MQFYLTAICLGLTLTMLGWGIYLSLKIFNIPDITTDGSYTLGAAITAIQLSNDGNWQIALLLSFIGGALAGMVTGFIHTRLRVNALLSGILVMTSLYSVNLMIMERSNIPLLQVQHIFSTIQFLSNSYVNQLLIVLMIAIIIGLLLVFMLKTDFGIAMRATGNSESMVNAMGVNTNRMKIIGLGLANALTALSGSIVAQFQQFSDINMGIGIVIFGLGAVMIGETTMDLIKKQGIIWRIFGVLFGCVIFRLIIAFTLASGADPNLLKLITALVVLVFVSIPQFKKMRSDA
jgi:putative ABC transport system permease protein